MAEIFDNTDSTNPGDWSYDAAERADRPASICRTGQCNVPGHSSLNCWHRSESLWEPGSGERETYAEWQATRDLTMWGADLTGRTWI